MRLNRLARQLESCCTSMVEQRICWIKALLKIAASQVAPQLHESNLPHHNHLFGGPPAPQFATQLTDLVENIDKYDDKSLGNYFAAPNGYDAKDQIKEALLESKGDKPVELYISGRSMRDVKDEEEGVAEDDYPERVTTTTEQIRESRDIRHMQIKTALMNIVMRCMPSKSCRVEPYDQNRGERDIERQTDR